ncbi:hypothetical protein EBO34_18425 [Alteribacter keqinensis]|uniref:Uncharacterized protein n=1 Tax=Alteribacter keqinensis TaxID=2483800 RepID=A0A3M7TR38_9BACI|nr:hypothetical protein EBO34_18425 [Alteribacter keqinensis]
MFFVKIVGFALAICCQKTTGDIHHNLLYKSVDWSECATLLREKRVPGRPRKRIALRRLPNRPRKESAMSVNQHLTSKEVYFFSVPVFNLKKLAGTTHLLFSVL